MSRQNPPPKGWFNYKPMKNVIEGTRFLPFKTPYRGYVKRGLEFNVGDLLNRVGNLGVVANLVQTHRYYNVEIYKTRDIKHERIPIRGGGDVPTYEEIKKVFRLIDHFIEANLEDDIKLVGVHCTHGVNRTGYVICRYMIEKLDFKPEEAIRRFEEGRGYPFDHVELTEALRLLKPAENKKLKQWHSIGGKIHRPIQPKEAELDFASLESRGRPVVAHSEQLISSTRESRNPQISPPTTESNKRKHSIGDLRSSHSERHDPPSCSASRTEHRSRSPAKKVRDTRTGYQELARDEESPGGLHRYLGSRKPPGRYHWPERYVGPRRDKSRQEC